MLDHWVSHVPIFQLMARAHKLYVPGRSIDMSVRISNNDPDWGGFVGISVNEINPDFLTNKDFVWQYLTSFLQVKAKENNET